MKIERTLGREPSFWNDVHQWMDEHVQGRSFAEVGGMWGGAWATFDAEQRGAAPVTMLDIMEQTDACSAEIEARGGSDCRFLIGDVHDPAALEQVGRHDVVLCSGVLYHCPNPVQTLERLRTITGEYLLLGTEVLHEVPGIPQACVFYPELTDEQRAAFAAPLGGSADGISTPFDPALEYANWWWGITRTALRGMMKATGWEILDLKTYHGALGYRALVIARPAGTNCNGAI
jgi:hypothetical protein